MADTQAYEQRLPAERDKADKAAPHHSELTCSAAMVGAATPQQMAIVLQWRSQALANAGFAIDAAITEAAAKMLADVDCWLCAECVARVDADDDGPALSEQQGIAQPQSEGSSHDQ